MTTGPQYSTSAANNTTMDGQAVSDAMSPAAVDNVLRNVGAAMGKLAGRQVGIKGATNTPPGSPSAGDRYLVTATASGAWAGQEHNIAVYVDTASPAWEFVTPDVGAVVAYFDGTSPIMRMYDGTDWDLFLNPVDPGHITGLELSNNATSPSTHIDIAAGSAASDDAVPVLLKLPSGVTKRLDAAWAVGTNQGGLDTGIIADGTYFTYLIARSDTGVADPIFSANPTTPTMPTNYDQKRRIGAIIRSGGAILAFSQNGDDFTLGTYPDAHTGGASGQTFSSATNIAMTVPIGIKVKAKVGITFFANSGSYVRLSDPDQADVAVSSSNYDCLSISTGGAGIHREVWTDTSGQVRFAATDASTTWYIKTIGWVDKRGK